MSASQSRSGWISLLNSSALLGMGTAMAMGIALVLPILLFSSGIMAADDGEFEAFVEDRMEQHRVAGVSIALVEEGEPGRLFAFGVKSAESAAPVTPDSVFQVGSVSKPVAAWAVMNLVQAGVLDLDTPVDEYLTRWQLPESEFDGTGVTLRRLLSHTAGLSLGGYPGFRLHDTLPGIEESLSGATNGSGAVYLQAEPGGGFSYSGGGYTLMQLIVEEVTGIPFSEYVSEAVLSPLGMESSSYTPDPALQSRLVEPHDFSEGVVPVYKFRAQAAASLHATAEDLGRFVAANLKPNDVLLRELVLLMHTPVASARGDNIGLGFFLSAEDRVVGHSGSNTGWKAAVRFVPTAGTGIVVLTSAESGDSLIQDTLCYWDKHYSIGILQDRCEARRRSIESTQREMMIAAVVIASVAAGITGFFLLSLVRGRRRIQPPSLVSWRGGSVGLFLVAASAFLLVVYTPLGVLMAAGMSFGIATIHYLPVGSGWVAAAFTALLLVFGSLGLLRKAT